MVKNGGKEGHESTISEIQRFVIVGSNKSPEPERFCEMKKQYFIRDFVRLVLGELPCAAVQLLFHLLNFLVIEEKYQTYNEFIVSLEAIFLFYIIQS